MKKILLLSAIAVLFAACQSKSEYTIHGEVADASYEGQQISLVEMTEDKMVTLDSTIVINGKFDFKGETETPVLRFLTLGEGQNQTRSLVMVEPGKINVVYDSGFKITGTPINNAYSEFDSKQKELNDQIRPLSNSTMLLWQTGL